MSRVLFTRLKNPCHNCMVLKSRLVGAKCRDYTIQDVDTPDGMATALLCEVQSTPTLLDGDEIVTNLDEIVWRLKVLEP